MYLYQNFFLTETASPSMRRTPAWPTTCSTCLRSPHREGIGAKPCLLNPCWRALKVCCNILFVKTSRRLTAGYLEYLRPLMRLWSWWRLSVPAELTTEERSALLRVTQGYYTAAKEGIRTRLVGYQEEPVSVAKTDPRRSLEAFQSNRQPISRHSSTTRYRLRRRLLCRQGSMSPPAYHCVSLSHKKEGFPSLSRQVVSDQNQGFHLLPGARHRREAQVRRDFTHH